MHDANPWLVGSLTAVKRKRRRTKIGKGHELPRRTEKMKKGVLGWRTWVLVLTLIICHREKSHQSLDGRRWEPHCWNDLLPLFGTRPKTPNLLGLFLQTSTNLLLSCMLSGWFIDFSNSKWLILLIFLNVKIKWLEWKICKILFSLKILLCILFYLYRDKFVLLY